MSVNCTVEQGNLYFLMLPHQLDANEWFSLWGICKVLKLKAGLRNEYKEGRIWSQAQLSGLRRRCVQTFCLTAFNKPTFHQQGCWNSVYKGGFCATVSATWLFSNNMAPRMTAFFLVARFHHHVLVADSVELNEWICGRAASCKPDKCPSDLQFNLRCCLFGWIIKGLC